MKTVRVMIADPLVEVVDRLEKILGEDRRIEIVARASAGQECLRKATISRPNVILMDLKFEDMSGSRLIRELSRKNLAVAVLILSPQATKDSPMLEACLNAGAFDFLARTGSLDDLEAIARQVLNRVFVASFSKTKQIPTGDVPIEEEEGPPEPGQASRPADLDVILVDAPGDRAREVLSLVAALQPGFKPAVVVLVRKPAPFAEKLVEKLKEKVELALHYCRDGDYILPGRVFFLESLDHDLLLERNISGEWVQITRCTASRERPVPMPGIDRLLDSLGRSYSHKAGAVLMGGDSQAGLDGLRALRARGGTAVVEPQSAELLAALQPGSAAGDLAHQVLTVEQVAGWINGMGHR